MAGQETNDSGTQKLDTGNEKTMNRRSALKAIAGTAAFSLGTGVATAKNNHYLRGDWNDLQKTFDKWVSNHGQMVDKELVDISQEKGRAVVSLEFRDGTTKTVVNKSTGDNGLVVIIGQQKYHTEDIRKHLPDIKNNRPVQVSNPTLATNEEADQTVSGQSIQPNQTASVPTVQPGNDAYFLSGNGSRLGGFGFGIAETYRDAQLFGFEAQSGVSATAAGIAGASCFTYHKYQTGYDSAPDTTMSLKIPYDYTATTLAAGASATAHIAIIWNNVTTGERIINHVVLNEADLAIAAYTYSDSGTFQIAREARPGHTYEIGIYTEAVATAVYWTYGASDIYTGNTDNFDTRDYANIDHVHLRWR